MLSISDVRKKAKTLGIVGSKMKKDELIRAIQQGEGNFPCFKSGQDKCDQNECLWREDCLSQE
jgi:hypothetical protein